MFSLSFLDETEIKIRRKKISFETNGGLCPDFLPVMILILSEERKTVFATAMLVLEMRCDLQRFK
jgi:hypothetical protein